MAYIVLNHNFKINHPMKKIHTLFFILILAYPSIIFSKKISSDNLTIMQSQKYEFILPEIEGEKLLEKLKLIRIGNSIENIKMILGNPTLEEEMIGKKGEFVAYALSYYLKRINMNTVNINDEVIDLYFDKKRELIKINKHCIC